MPDPGERTEPPFADSLVTDEIERARPKGPSADREIRRRRLAEQLFGVVEAEPVRFGRFVLLERLGEGGVGTVHIAYDPQLDRRVALKLLRPAQRSPGLRLRMLREAQALARLSHPNVVPVHDAGIIDEQVFIVMEYVRGRTLGRWVDEERPSWRQLLAVYIQAGRGLAAAHRAGVIHRDFKPENAIRGDDGRVRVLDFGLARGVDDGATSTVPDAELEPATERDDGSDDEGRDIELLATTSAESTRPTGVPRGGELQMRLTATGAMMGTPAYMAPEQLLCESTDARTDQFSFCASLWEALYGVRPFAAETLAALSEAIQTGSPQLPSGSRVPGWLQQVIIRGLAVDPGARWPSMDELLAALARDPTRKRWSIGAVAIAAVVGVGAFGAAIANDLVLEAACADEASVIEEVWNDAARGRLREAFEGSNRSYALTSYDRTVDRLDSWAEVWRTTSAEACLAHDLHASLSDARYEQTIGCLSEGKQDFGLLVASLARGHESAIQGSVSAAAALNDAARCVDPTVLQRRPELPVGQAAAIRQVQGKISEATTIARLGDYPRASALLTSALGEAEVLDWEPLITRTKYELVHTKIAQEEFGEVESELREIYFEAREEGLHELSVRAAESLAWFVGTFELRIDDGLLWADLAAAELAEFAEPADLLEAKVERRYAQLLERSGERTDAMSAYQRSMAHTKRAVDDDHPEYATALNSLGNAHAMLGEFAEARDMYEAAIESHERAFGPEHPALRSVLLNLGYAEARSGEFEGGVETLQRNIELTVGAFGWSHSMTARAYLEYGVLYHEHGELGRAREYYETALSIVESLDVESHLLACRVMVHVGEILIEDPSMASLARAGEMFERALRAAEQVGEQSSMTFYPLEGLARVAFANGHFRRALAYCEDALAVSQVKGERRVSVTHAENLQFFKVRSLWALGERDHAREVAAQILASLASEGPEAEPLVARVEAWLDDPDALHQQL